MEEPWHKNYNTVVNAWKNRERSLSIKSSVNLKECHPHCVYQNYSRSVMEGIAVNNTTIFVIYNNVSTTCFGDFPTGHHHVGYNVRGRNKRNMNGLWPLFVHLLIKWSPTENGQWCRWSVQAELVCLWNYFRVFYVELLAQKYSKLAGVFYFYILMQCSKCKYYRTMTLGTATITLVNKI